MEIPLRTENNILLPMKAWKLFGKTLGSENYIQRIYRYFQIKKQKEMDLLENTSEEVFKCSTTNFP